MRLSIVVAALLVILLGPSAATAHLLSAGHGAVNLREDDAIILIGVPVHVFTGVDDDGDGLLQPDEIQRHTDEIMAQLARGFSLTADGKAGIVTEKQLLVSVHADDKNSTPQIEWWARIAFPTSVRATPCAEVGLHWFLADQPAELQMTYQIQVRRGDATEMALLNKDKPLHRFLCQE